MSFYDYISIWTAHYYPFPVCGYIMRSFTVDSAISKGAAYCERLQVDVKQSHNSKNHFKNEPL